MKHILLILSFISLNNSYGQVETANSKKVADLFHKHYNSADYEAIYNLYATSMQQALSLYKTTNFLTGLNSQAGKIIEREFIKYNGENSAYYKTTFDKALFSLEITIDDEAKITGFLVRPFKDSKLPKIERNTTELILPFKDEWNVVWGGDTKEQNYHVESIAQKNAFDIVIMNEEGKSYKNSGEKNEDYYAFGKELIAPCDAEVVLVVDGVKDNTPGDLNPIYVPGNTVILKTVNNEYLFFAHFKQHSIKVKQGDKVKQGQTLGQCGNSGNSSEPHLHFHIQNVENMNFATGVKCYFKEIKVNGKIKNDYSPVQNEKIENN